MLKIIDWENIDKAVQKKLLQRPYEASDQSLKKRVKKIIEEVRTKGDWALLNYTAVFDKVNLNTLRVSSQEIKDACEAVPDEISNALKQVKAQLVKFHEKQKPENYSVETSPGIVCEKQFRALETIGLYIPGGSAPLVSTVMMLGVPAELAGCLSPVICTPPNRSGMIDPIIIAAASLCGISTIFKVGGAQAIAAMAYGTESIPKVDKIFGPGNRWVTQAKQLVAEDSRGACYDLPAGPSEVMVIADETAHPAFVAADLLSQAEHGIDSQVILICETRKFAGAVNSALSRQLVALPRQSIASTVLKNSMCLIVSAVNEGISIANQYAPEHLILHIREPGRSIPHIQNAGSVFLGPWSPESAGDYASGTNHVLPTQGYAKCLSSLSVSDFMTAITFQTLTKAGLATIAKSIQTLTKIEGLDAHWQAVNIRLAGEMS